MILGEKNAYGTNKKMRGKVHQKYRKGEKQEE